ncbi:MAG: hypothetical protein ACK5V3_13430 [Bdellovibrionales bacterium]
MKVSNKIIIVFLMTSLTLITYANPVAKPKETAKATQQSSALQEIIKQMPVCDTADLMIEPEGYQCKTLKGGLFEKRISSEGDVFWIDLRNRKSWYISSVGGRSQADAGTFCSRLKHRLPREEDFLQGESVGFRGTFQLDARQRYFWIQTEKIDLENARVFSAVSGSFEQIPLLHKKNTKASVICVK